MKKKLLVFSDCFTYIGSENVVENILLSKRITEEYDVNFIYGYSKAYEHRFLQRSASLGIDLINSSSVKLLSPDIHIYEFKLAKKNSLNRLKQLMKAALFVFLKTIFVSHLYNFLILKREFKKGKFDAVYINNGGYPASLQCCLAVFVAKFVGIEKIFFNINNMAMPRRVFYDRLLDGYINKNVTRFVTASYSAQKRAIASRDLDENKFVRIPNSIYNDWSISNLYKESCQASDNDHTFTFGSIGLLTERKGFHVLLEAVRTLVYDYKIKNFQVKIIGDGEEKNNLFDFIKEHQLADYVNLLGFQSDPLTYLKDFDVFILPSTRNEDFPYVILEAMVLSKPIIGTRVAGIPEQIDEGRNGYLVNPNDPNGLAHAMKTMAENEKLISFGRHGNEKYFDLFSYQGMEQKYIELFDS